MRQHTINLFMWGYQPHYRILLERRAENVFEQLGVTVSPKVLLVGARAPNNDNPNPVCVEPEDGEWPLTLFTDLLDSVEIIVNKHPLQKMFYGDEQSTRDKPEAIRRDSVTTAVRESLLPYDNEHSLRSFCGTAYQVGDYYVVPVIQVPEIVFQMFPPLNETATNEPWSTQGHRSFIHACMEVLLAEATEELHRPDPGKSHMKNMSQAGEIVRIAATSFMQTPGQAINDMYTYTDLFERFNLISSLMYEGVHGIGRLMLVDPESNAFSYVVRFKTPVPFRESRWARKILQMAEKDLMLIADNNHIYGLGRLQTNHDPSEQDVFIVNFLDHFHWELRCGDQILLRSHFGEPKLPQEPISRDHFIVNYARLFPESSADNHSHIWRLFNTAIHQTHGSMIVVAEDAIAEAKRLTQQGTSIEPMLMTEELLSHVSRIDGTIILDPQSVCHAVGVILDGVATPDCTPSRGSRFNSGLRYVNAGGMRRLAIIVSDDNTVDIIPLLKPQINRDDVEMNITLLEKATLDDYHKPRNWLEDHRFYLSKKQCKKVNSALDQIENLPRGMGEIVIITTRFKPDPLLDDSYFITPYINPS